MEMASGQKSWPPPLTSLKRPEHVLILKRSKLARRFICEVLTRALSQAHGNHYAAQRYLSKHPSLRHKAEDIRALTLQHAQPLVCMPMCALAFPIILLSKRNTPLWMWSSFERMKRIFTLVSSIGKHTIW